VISKENWKLPLLIELSGPEVPIHINPGAGSVVDFDEEGDGGLSRCWCCRFG
jgi:hypothetical protein